MEVGFVGFFPDLVVSRGALVNSVVDCSDVALVAPQQMSDAVLCLCLLRYVWPMHHTVGHYQLAVKCVDVCTCVSNEVAKFLYHISDVLGLSYSLLHTWDLFMVAFRVLRCPGMLFLILR